MEIKDVSIYLKRNGSVYKSFTLVLVGGVADNQISYAGFSHLSKCRMPNLKDFGVCTIMFKKTTTNVGKMGLVSF